MNLILSIYIFNKTPICGLQIIYWKYLCMSWRVFISGTPFPVTKMILLDCIELSWSNVWNTASFSTISMILASVLKLCKPSTLDGILSPSVANLQSTSTPSSFVNDKLPATSPFDVARTWSCKILFETSW